MYCICLCNEISTCTFQGEANQSLSTRICYHVSLCFAGKQTKNQALDRFLWRGVFQSHHCCYPCYPASVANAWSANAGLCHPERGLLPSNGLPDNSFTMCTVLGTLSVCVSHWSCHIPVSLPLMHSYHVLVLPVTNLTMYCFCDPSCKCQLSMSGPSGKWHMPFMIFCSPEHMFQPVAV